MNESVCRIASLGTALWLLSLQAGFAAGLSKTVRVDHGRPLVVVSQHALLLFEFVTEPATNAIAADAPSDTRHCRARYRYQLFNGTGDTLTRGEGAVEEVYRTTRHTAAGREVKDMGSQVTIHAGEFHLWWSEASAGARSWVYYRANSGIRFIQQPQRIAFDAVDREMIRRYLASKNVEELVTADRRVQVIGPAVFAGDLPEETPVSARIESCRLQDGALELALSNLATDRPYLIESSYELKPGSWNVVHSFIARQSTHHWSDPLAKGVTTAFYRIREGR